MVAKAIIYYILPLLIIGVLYALMARRLHLSAAEMPGELAGPQSRAQARARRHVARMVMTFVIGMYIFQNSSISPTVHPIDFIWCYDECMLNCLFNIDIEGNKTE